ncbi:MAG: TadE/TadG family type IV pilus assembly protein [Sedimenticolaceae bacterium]
MKQHQIKLLRRQAGAETVEFMITLLLFFTVFFIVIEFAIATYDRGTINNAVREGSRQASLYWVDPVLFDPETPEQNQRLKYSMVESVITWTENNLLVDFGGGGMTLTLNIGGSTLGSGTAFVDTTDEVLVNIAYDHSFLALDGLLSSPSFTLATQSGSGVE